MARPDPLAVGVQREISQVAKAVVGDVLVVVLALHHLHINRASIVTQLKFLQNKIIT